MQFLIQTILIIGIVCGWPEEAYMQNTSNARPGMDGSANRRRELPGRPQVGAIRWDASKPNGQPRRKLDTTRAREYFGFNAKTDFEEGLRRTIAWYQEHRS